MQCHKASQSGVCHKRWMDWQLVWVILKHPIPSASAICGVKSDVLTGSSSCWFTNRKWLNVEKKEKIHFTATIKFSGREQRKAERRRMLPDCRWCSASSRSCHMDRSQACYLSSTDSEISQYWQLRRNLKGHTMSISVRRQYNLKGGLCMSITLHSFDRYSYYWLCR